MSLKSWSTAIAVIGIVGSLGCGGGGENGQPDIPQDVDSGDPGTPDDGGPPAECATDGECEDKFTDLGQCETYFCNLDLDGGTCERKPLADGTACQDGDDCTQNDLCDAGECAPGTECECRSDGDCKDKFADLDQCEAYFCDSTVAGGTCDRNDRDDGTECDDDNPCTHGDQCTTGECVPGLTLVCDCLTDEECLPREDGDLCNGTLFCDLKHFPYKCVLDTETVVECDPAGDTLCQENLCVTDTGLCEMTPVKEGEPCEDNDVCTKTSTCQSGFCSALELVDCDDDEGCTDDSCDSVLGCIHTPNTDECDDEDACTTLDQCVNGACQGGPEPECNNGMFCDGAESCDTAIGCVDGTPPDCDDGNECTLDACDTGADECVHDMLPTAKEGPLGSDTCLDDLDNDCDGLKDNADPECSFGITGIDPEEGPSTGGTAVLLTGGGFDLIQSLTFGGVPVEFTVISANALSLTTQPHDVGDVSVTLSNGWIEFTLDNAFRYTGKAFGSGLNAVFQSPADHTMSEGDTLADAAASVEVTLGPADPAGIIAQVGFGPKDSLPWADPEWTWIDMTDVGVAGSTIDWEGDVTVELGGYFNMAARFSADDGYTWEFGDLDGSDNGYDPSTAATLTVWGVPSSGEIVINELMWMGSNESTYDEWFELRNMTRAPFDLGGFKLTQAGPVGTDFVFEAVPHVVNNLYLEPYGYFLVSEKAVDDSSLAVAPDIEGMNTMVLPNTPPVTYLLVSGTGTVVDQALFTGTEGYNGDAALGKSDKSMERNWEPGDGTQVENWHTAFVHEGWDGDPLQVKNWGTPRGPNSDIARCAGDADCADAYPDLILDACEKRVCSLASFRCTVADREEGEACDDGFDYTDNDMCSAGVCQGEVNVEPTVFRIDSFEVTKPTLTYDFGNGPVEVNDLVSALVTLQLDSFDAGGLVSAFTPLDLQFPDAGLEVGVGQCAKAENAWIPCCTLDPGGDSVQFTGVTYMEAGNCLGEPLVQAPCFVTATDTFSLSDIIPDVFPGDVGNVEGSAAGPFTGDPIDGIVGGIIEGFLPQTAAANITFELSGLTIKGTDLIDPSSLEIHGGVPGYWIGIGFTAERNCP